jgi:transposase
VAEIICGVDVASQTLAARIGPDGPELEVERTAEGIDRLAGFCRGHGVEMVVMEATGGYEKLPFALLWAAGLPCAIANPRAVRRFAEAMGLLEKTDRIDAGVIARFAAVKGLVPQPPASAAQDRLRALVSRLHQLTAVKVAHGNQRRFVREPEVLAMIDDLLALVRRQTRQLETQIASLLATDPLWQALDQAFRSIKGVADRTVARLMADLPEIGTVSGKAVGKLAGLAPMARDSGKLNGKRRTRGGRAGIRSTLFLVAEIVRRYDPDFAAFHRKLSQAGKPKKVVRTALAHKLLIRLNAKARDVRLQIAAAA